MLLSLIAVSVVLAGWSLLARRLESWRLTAPMVLVLAGIAVGFATRDQVAASLNTDAAEHIAEVILAILLFVTPPTYAAACSAGNRGRRCGCCSS